VLQLDDSVELVPGVGPSRAAELRAGGILLVSDLLAYLPMRYEDRSERTALGDLQPGQRTGVEVEILTIQRKGPPGRRQQVELRVADETGEARVVWFNQPYVARRFSRGDRVRLFGPVDEYKGNLQIVNPVVVDAEMAADSLHVGRPVPIYRRIGELGPGILRRLVAGALDALDELNARLPEAVVAEHALMPLRRALTELHYPPQGCDLGQWDNLRSEAHRALVMAELVDFQVVLGLQRQRASAELGFGRQLADGTVRRILCELPFVLTGAQTRVLRDVVGDLRSSAPMHRLVQGDVGCGKTAVLGVASIAVALAGEQAAVLAPTEILARQHARTLGAWAQSLGIDVILTTGSDSAPARRSVRGRLRDGDAVIVIGTHALLEDDVEFVRLGLVVIDEQHRFGVGQRAALRAKGKRQGRQPDLLVTTATPIPRSLALTLYGDLEVSRIDEMPAGRQPIVTRQMPRSAQGELVAKLKGVAAESGRAFVVAPAIDPDEDGAETLATVATVGRDLKDALGDKKVGILHGRLDAAAKERAIADFASGATPVLVCTTVIEVGVDVPAATLMVVLQADRFGLAQLHQLRGRVGRGERASECWLMTDEPLSEIADARMTALCDTHDGFVVAERDLELRGAGELLGYRQTGAFGFRIANPRLHADWLVEARDIAARMLIEDDAAATVYRAALRESWRARMQLTRAG